MIFVDTSALVALLDRDDRFHAAAAGVLTQLLTSGEPLFTHEYVLVESTALVQRRLGLDQVRRLTSDLLPLIEVVWVDAALHGAARDALLAAGRRAVSLVDWTSFLVMRRHGARRAFTFDEDFAAEGFAVIPGA